MSRRNIFNPNVFVSNCHYFLCRFYFIRRLSRFMKSNFYKKTNISPLNNDFVLNNLTTSEIVDSVNRLSFSKGLSLNADAIKEIQVYSKTAILTSRMNKKNYELTYNSRIDLEKNIRVPCILAHVTEPMKCSAIKSICHNQVIFDISKRYLRYSPQKVEAKLFWSFSCQQSESERLESYQTVRYHYDLHGFNFVYFNFYLSEVTMETGPHVLIESTHLKKPIKFLLSSAEKGDQELLKYYGERREMVILGPEGLGFVEDAFCYHKALAPKSGERLMLQLRIT